MRASYRQVLSFAPILLIGLTAAAQPIAGKSVLTLAPRPSTQVSNADAIVVGKVAEVEADSVEALPYKGADQKITYKVAVLKIDEPLLGAGGLTRFRVGFPADASTTTPADVPPVTRVRRPGRPPMAVALTAGQEGCFCLTRHPTADFYVLTGPPLAKTDDKFAGEVEKVKKAAKAVTDPVAALKAKDLDDRFQAAFVILQRYQRNPTGRPVAREPIPEEENKLIVALLKELPWLPDQTKPVEPGGMMVSRGTLWNQINWAEQGFKQPTFQANPGQPAVDFNKVMDEESAKFLKENGEKIRIKRVVQK
jgi:hypothetical protein